MTDCSSAKTGTCAVGDPTSQHERAYHSGEEKLEDLKIIIESVLQSLKKDDSSSPKGIDDFGLKLKKGRSASLTMSEKDLIYELEKKCSSRDRGGKKLKGDLLKAAIEVLQLLGGLPFAAVPSSFLVASLTRGETSSKNKREAAEVISELKRFVDFLLAKMDLCMPLMHECVNVVDEGFWLCTSILIEGKLEGWFGAPSNKESIEKLKQRCGECEKRIHSWLMVTILESIEKPIQRQESIEKLIHRHGEWLMITKSDADLCIKEEPSGAKIEKYSFKSEASIKTMELFLSTDKKVYDTTSIQAVNPQMKKSASVHEDEEAAEASMKTMAVSPSEDTKAYDTISSQAANPQMKKSASTSSVQEDEEPAKVSMKFMAVPPSIDTRVYDTISSQAANPQMMKSASVHGDEESLEPSPSKDSKVYNTTSSQAGNPQMKKSASVHKDAPSPHLYEICHGTLATIAELSYNYVVYGQQPW